MHALIVTNCGGSGSWREDESVGQRLEQQFDGHAANEDVLGDLQGGRVHDAHGGRLEDHRRARHRRHHDHHPVEVGDQSEEVVGALVAHLPLLAGDGIARDRIVTCMHQRLDQTTQSGFATWSGERIISVFN